MSQQAERLQAEIERLRNEMKTSIAKKKNGKSELSISDYMVKIKKLEQQLQQLDS